MRILVNQVVAARKIMLPLDIIPCGRKPMDKDAKPNTI